ncbi:MAG: aconitate hydratase [Bacteroidales bacterium]|nr:aconitate hydratase [Bacteroidales bacterium]
MNNGIKSIRNFYRIVPEILEGVRKITGHPLTLTEKILYCHLFRGEFPDTPPGRGKDHAFISPDRVAMQDATAQMAILQFMVTGRRSSSVPVSVHCDHLIVAGNGAEEDLRDAVEENREIYDFLRTASERFGMDFREPGEGIIHQVILENYAFPGGMIAGTDSHTPTAGGLGMLGIGVGGMDAVDAMTGLPWELKWPKITGVKLTGKLNGWSSPKDVILKLAGLLTVRGGTGCILEYFGPGCSSISATGKATICNMGAETGATSSVFGYDETMERYLCSCGRKSVAHAASAVTGELNADPAILESPEKYFDQVIEINLSELLPSVNGPFTPDLSTPLPMMKEAVARNRWPDTISAALIGSCTNSSSEDLSRAASVIRFAVTNDIPVKAALKISPGSETVRRVAENYGLMQVFRDAGAEIFSNACGPCIGQWKRKDIQGDPVNTIVHSFNRNFSKRADGNPNTHAFVASPEIAAALAVAGSLSFNPLMDELMSRSGEKFRLPPPEEAVMPVLNSGRNKQKTKRGKENVEIIIDPQSDRLQLLRPFPAWDGKDLTNLVLLMKAAGKCTTDHISMAGKWLKYRGHLENISANYMSGAVNSFSSLQGTVVNHFTGENEAVHKAARSYMERGMGSVVAGEENFGEGSSREHAAMEPRYLGVSAVIVKSFARIHETNLKKQGILTLTFSDANDYARIREDDRIDITGLENFSPGSELKVILHHSDGTEDSFPAVHSYSETQTEWFRAGSALNLIRSEGRQD